MYFEWLVNPEFYIYAMFGFVMAGLFIWSGK